MIVETSIEVWRWHDSTYVELDIEAEVEDHGIGETRPVVMSDIRVTDWRYSHTYDQHTVLRPGFLDLERDELADAEYALGQRYVEASE